MLLPSTYIEWTQHKRFKLKPRHLPNTTSHHRRLLDALFLWGRWLYGHRNYYVNELCLTSFLADSSVSGSFTLQYNFTCAMLCPLNIGRWLLPAKVNEINNCRLEQDTHPSSRFGNGFSSVGWPSGKCCEQIWWCANGVQFFPLTAFLFTWNSCICFIHSFKNFCSAPSRQLLRSAPNSSLAKKVSVCSN